MRKITKTLTSTTQLLKLSEDRFALKTRAIKLMKLETIEFTPGEEFEEKTLDGRKVKSTIVFDDNKMIHSQHGEKPLRVERRFFNDEMIAITTYGDVVSTSWNKLVE
jgi:fatty acid-binding protein 3, muscle and heart